MGKENSEFKPAVLHLKIKPVSHLAFGEGLGKYIHAHTHTHTHTCTYMYMCACVNMYTHYLCVTGHWHNGYSIRQWPGRPGFNPRSSHTKDSKNGT